MQIDVSVWERKIAAEYLRLFGHEMTPQDREATTQIVNIASTAAAIALKLYVEELEESK